MNTDESQISWRVILADDHALVRAGIRALLEEIPSVQVVAEASDGKEALRLIAAHKPELVLLDLSMPGLNGFKVLELAAKEFPQVRVIILTVHEEDEYAVHALRAGAAGYLSKSAACSELSLAVETVRRGEKFLSPRLSIRSFLEHSMHSPQSNGSGVLTPRQVEVCRMIAMGLSVKEIAFKLKISTKTAESHRANLMERLDIHDVAGLVRHAIKTGLVKIDEDWTLELLDSVGVISGAAERSIAGRDSF